MEDILIQYNESLKNSYQYFRPKRIDFQDSFAVNFDQQCEKIFHCLDVYHNDVEENLLPVLGHIPPTDGRPFSPAACHNNAQLKMVYMACGGLSIFCIILALIVYLALPKLFNLHGKVVLHIQSFKLLGLHYFHCELYKSCKICIFTSSSSHPGSIMSKFVIIQANTFLMRQFTFN